jgi:alkanesulfonate monooxygenase SsuD/methylene tetrahydromethanopterin reductase-like flavin-dependent oxidoreductase (luciferase family)
MNTLDFYVFNTIHYPYVPSNDAEGANSKWVTLSNKYFDARLAHQIYTSALNISVAAERFGYDGTLVNEHHCTAYSLQPAPNLTAMNIVARTTEIPVGMIGNALPLFANPVRVAEEVAMLDVISGGRIISGFVVGTGMEYFSQPINPAFSRDRFWEAHDLILRAWTEPGPFAWEGDNFHIPSVNPWPLPLQKPHPPIWIPGIGSMETIRKCAEKRYHYMTVYTPRWFAKFNFDAYKKYAREEFGYEPSPKQMSATVPVYVAETDEQAHREVKAYLSWLFNTGLRHPEHYHVPPGYATKESFVNFLGARMKHGLKPHCELSYDELVKDRYIVVGSPQTVTEILAKEYVEDLGVGGIIGVGSHFGPMPEWMVMKNMQITAEEVIPHFREAHGQPSYKMQKRAMGTTHAEQAAEIGRPKYPGVVRVTGIDREIELAKGHVAEIIDPSLRHFKQAAE